MGSAESHFPHDCHELSPSCHGFILPTAFGWTIAGIVAMIIEHTVFGSPPCHYTCSCLIGGLAMAASAASHPIPGPTAPRATPSAAIFVGMARKKYGVNYPTLYATATAGSTTEDGENSKLVSKAITEEDAFAFNCVQRVHQNNCEILPTMLVTTLIGGLIFPALAGALAMLFVVGRAVYAWGYYQEPKKRIYGGFYNIGSVGMLLLNLVGAVWLLTWSFHGEH
eukprot:gene1429-2777_t